LSLKGLGLTGEQVRTEARQALAERSAVAAKLDEAGAQARAYGATLRERHGLQALHAFAVVALGFERLVWRSVL
ncbi:MAG: AAA family ATPase, partial [Chromatiaceae bacterium]|nr:AAA family ATPase [Chromatiaceae bacterium]